MKSNIQVSIIVDRDPIAQANLRALTAATANGQVEIKPVFGNVREAIVRNALRRCGMTVRYVHGEAMAVRITEL